MKIREFAITSRSNPLVAETVKLQKKRERDESGRFLVDGRKLCYEYIRKCGKPHLMFVCCEQLDAILSELDEIERECGISLDIIPVAESVFSKLTMQNAPDGIILVGERSALPRSTDAPAEWAGEMLIMLDCLQDPGNVGTVIRTALALGYDRVVLGGECADIYNPKTLRASMGAVFSIRISVCDSLADVIGDLRSAGRRVYAAELREHAVSLDDTDIMRSDVFVIGNEGHGIADNVSGACDRSVYIPISEQSESLNAAVAATVLMWHQRNSRG